MRMRICCMTVQCHVHMQHHTLPSAYTEQFIISTPYIMILCNGKVRTSTLQTIMINKIADQLY